jgi:acetolactate synthase-1/2/3 large subunit
MGYGLAAAIGACLGNGSQHTIAVESDGSLMLNLQELANLRGLNLPIKLIVMDNNGYASIRNTQRNNFDSRFIATGAESSLHMPDLGAIAEAMHLPCVHIHVPDNLKPGLANVMQAVGPVVCIVHLVTDETLWPKVAAMPQPDGSILSMPLEDMTPLLPLANLEEEMLVSLMNASYDARKNQ